MTAAAGATHPELFTFADVRVAVELAGSYTRGMTIAESDEDFNAVPGGTCVSVARRVRADEVRALFTTRVLDATWTWPRGRV